MNTFIVLYLLAIMVLSVVMLLFFITGKEKYARALWVVVLAMSLSLLMIILVGTSGIVESVW